MKKNKEVKKEWLNLSDLIKMGYSKNSLQKRFYGQLKGKKPEDFGIVWHTVTKKEKAVSWENYKKHFDGVLKRKPSK